MEAGKVELEKTFSKDLQLEVDKIIDEIVQTHCKGKDYDPKFGQQWSNDIAEKIVQQAQTKVDKDFKAMCLAMVLNKETSGFHMSASCFWDAKADGNINKKIDFPTFYVIVTFFGIARN